MLSRARCFGLIFLLVGCRRPQLPPVVALITVDTWRLDHFSAESTPHLWALAARGERWTNAWTPIGLTSPAHATMLTGLPPWEHGMEANNHHGYRLRDDVTVLPERYQGWATGAFVSAYPAGPEGGLGRGWDTFSAPESGERPGDIAVSEALAWLPRDRPALLWVHLYEPHGPYQGEGSTDRARYGEEVHRADAMLAPLLDALVERDATIVVAADHGEVLDEETCGWQHERSSGEGVLRVPLLRWTQGGSPAVHDDLVGLTDVPALLAGEAPAHHDHWLAESGMCEPGCTPGCAPPGLMGRDRVVVGAGGRWVQRPGRGRFAVGQPAGSLQRWLDDIPAVPAPNLAPVDAQTRALGYTP